RLFGLTVAYNLLVLLGFGLSGFALYLLARRFGCGTTAAICAGIAYTAADYHVFQLSLGHLEHVSIQWLPLYALALDHMLRASPPDRHAARRVTPAVLALLAVFFTSLYHALYAAILTLMLLVMAGLASVSWPDRRRMLIDTLLLAGVVVAITGPLLLVPMLREAGSSGYMLRTIDDAARGSIPLAGVVVPPPSHLLQALLPQPAVRGAFLGYSVLLAALIGLMARPKSAAPWGILALLAWLLALGPILPFYQWLYTLPPIQAARYPGHFIILVLLGVALLAGLGIDTLVRRSGRLALPVAGLCLLLVV
ncbi:MAG TPA: hypothetical protein PKC19_19345, partial [Roseiflexaceae bacterium]|nr:hypothetical protein [Roseiflexaceae bacterium]